MLTIEQAKKVLNYLERTKQVFCFLMDGQLISRDDCQRVLNQFNAEVF